MANVSVPNKQQIRQKYPELAEGLFALESSINNLGTQTNSSPVGVTPAPIAPAKLTVTAGQGYFRAHIDDNSPSYRGKEYFLEASEDANFTNPHKMHLGATTDHYVQLGPKMLHFRAYAGHDTTAPSQMVYHMSVNGAGGEAPSISGNGGAGTGYGMEPYTTTLPPKRA